jgi:F0F1-type ATP synthase membrane subunit b/b'
VSEGPSAAARETTSMTSLPNVDDLPVVEQGYDETRVREAFDAFRRHVVQLQAQLRVLQAAGRTAQVDPTGHAVRMDALHLIREAAEFADVLERDAQRASAGQLQRTEQEVRQRQQEIQERETEIQRFREESERQRNEILTAARNEARQLVADANREAAKELREAEARGARLLEQSRHQATELTNATRAEVEQTLEWARAQATTIIARAQQGTEQLLAAAGLGEARANEVADEIVKAAETQATSARAAETTEPESAPESSPLRAAPEASEETPEPEQPAVEPEAGETPPTSPETEDSR